MAGPWMINRWLMDREKVPNHWMSLNNNYHSPWHWKPIKTPDGAITWKGISQWLLCIAGVWNIQAHFIDDDDDDNSYDKPCVYCNATNHHEELSYELHCHGQGRNQHQPQPWEWSHRRFQGSNKGFAPAEFYDLMTPLLLEKMSQIHPICADTWAGRFRSGGNG